MNTRNVATDRSNNKKYFTMVPRIVRLKSRSPYDISAWLTVVDIAGEDGECDYSTEDLAALSLMSIGKFSDCRAYLIKEKLLEGRIETAERGQARWHLTVPDLWKENIRVAKQCNSIKKRIEFNKEHTVSKEEKPSPHESTKPSPRESKLSSHEGKPSPRENASFIEKTSFKKTLYVDEKTEKNNFETLLDYWFYCKGEVNPGTPPPKYRGKSYVDVVAERLEDPRTWKELSDAVAIYWKIVKSPEHYYDHRYNETEFFAVGIDRFWNGAEQWENLKKKVNGNSSRNENNPAFERYVPA